MSKKAQKLRCVERDDDLSSSNLATPVRTKETGIENPSSNEDKSLTVQRSSRPRPPLASIDTNAGKKQSVSPNGTIQQYDAYLTTFFISVGYSALSNEM